jgi:hypothetical protein
VKSLVLILFGLIVFGSSVTVEAQQNEEDLVLKALNHTENLWGEALEREQARSGKNSPESQRLLKGYLGASDARIEHERKKRRLDQEATTPASRRPAAAGGN